MNVNPSDNNNANIKRKPKGSPLALTISIALVLLAIAGYFIDKNKKATQANSAVTSVQQTTKVEKPEEKKVITKEEFNKQLENSIRENLGNTYGDFKIEYTNIKNTCRFKLTFESDLTDAEAHTIGTTGVRALLKEFKQTDEIKMILNGRKDVYVKVYSMKLKTGGELRGTFKDRTYMGEATYRPDSDRIEWGYSKW